MDRSISFDVKVLLFHSTSSPGRRQPDYLVHHAQIAGIAHRDRQGEELSVPIRSTDEVRLIGASFAPVISGGGLQSKMPRVCGALRLFAESKRSELFR
ncbi:MAG TPA: hypothetical protein VNS58_28375 [Puia sp.]|nr:hypothetical protein [Puia sp.]